MRPGAPYRFNRHVDTARNPVTVNVIRRETIPTPMGELRVFLVEMRVDCAVTRLFVCSDPHDCQDSQADKR